MNRGKKKKTIAQGTIFSKMKETKNHLGFHTDNLEEIELGRRKNTKQTKGKRKNTENAI